MYLSLGLRTRLRSLTLSMCLKLLTRVSRLPQAAAASTEKLCPEGIDVLINMAGVDLVVVLCCLLNLLRPHMSSCCARNSSSAF